MASCLPLAVRSLDLRATGWWGRVNGLARPWVGCGGLRSVKRVAATTARAFQAPDIRARNAGPGPAESSTSRGATRRGRVGEHRGNLDRRPGGRLWLREAAAHRGPRVLHWTLVTLD